MNIRGVNFIPVAPVDPKPRVEGNSRTEASTDRDADGRREANDGELKRHLTQQEFDDALAILKENPGLKSNNLVLKVETHDDHRVILILDPTGNVVRRLSEAQLWSATRDKDRQTGKILDKAM